MDYELQKSSRVCSVAGNEIPAGETFYTALVREGADVRRVDYAAESWTGPPPNTVGWWKSTMPERDATGKKKMAPSEVLLGLFHELSDAPDRRDLRYVLTLLLIRRRLLRLEETTTEAGCETMTLYCPRDEQTYRVSAVVPSDERVAEIQRFLSQLLYTPG